MKKYVLIFVTSLFLIGCSSSKSAVNGSEDPTQVEEQSLALADPFKVTKMPVLIGGIGALLSRVKYPEKARKYNTEGRVLIVFIVKKDGNPTNLKVLKGIGNGCDEEALRAVRKAKFKPAEKDGEPVNVRFLIPVEFSLSR